MRVRRQNEDQLKSIALYMKMPSLFVRVCVWGEGGGCVRACVYEWVDEVLICKLSARSSGY